jgi:hypothetical protein
VIQELRRRSQEENDQELDIQGLDATGDAVLYSCSLKLVDCYDGHCNHVGFGHGTHYQHLWFPDDSAMMEIFKL